MNLERDGTGILRLVLKQVLLCVVLGGIGLVALWGVVKLAEGDIPFVDLTAGEQSQGPSPSFAGREETLRFAVATMVSVQATFSSYQQLVDRICADVGRKKAFVLRPSYAEVREALEENRIDVAFVCTGTYIHSLRKKRARLLAQPEFINGLEYRSLLIVPADSPAKDWEDLRGRVMAFTDPESNTGCLVPSAVLAQRGLDPKSFFKETMYTGSHDRSILAVVQGIADAAAVDALVWESARRRDPSIETRAKVIWTSIPFGPPPIMVPAGLDESLKEALLQAFLALDKDEDGRRILSEIGIKRFVVARPDDYTAALELYESIRAKGDAQWP